MLIEPEELHRKLNSQNTILLCCLLKPIGSSTTNTEAPEFISGSRIFDIDEFSESSAEFPHTLLSPKAFEEKARALGIDDDSEIYVYDPVGIYSSPRMWFNFALMGCKNIVLLDGGLPNWKSKGYPVATTLDSNMNNLGNFSAHPAPKMLADKHDVLKAIGNQDCIVVDVRSSGRFFGSEPEPRKGARGGHIPGSANIPFPNFIEGNRFKKKDELMGIFEEAGCQESSELIFSCGSGVTACIGYFAAHLCGYRNIKVYDGSWAEWGSTESLPVEV